MLESWHIIAAAFVSAIAAALTKWLGVFFRSRKERKQDKYAEKSAEIDHEEKEVSVERNRADRAWRRSALLEERIDNLLKDVDRIKDELAQAKLEVGKERNARIDAEYQRDYYRTLLARLVRTLAASCKCGLDLSEYEKAVET